MTLLLSKSQKVSRTELKSIPTPMPTSSWHPVPHYQLAELVNNEADRRGFHIIDESYGISADGSKMFGVLRFHPEGHPEYTRALGIRNSNNKTFSVGLVAGLSVLVCDNLCFGGGTTIYRRHTSGIDMDSLIPSAFDSIGEQYNILEQRVASLKVEMLSIDDAKLVVVKAAEYKAIPSCDIIPVLKEFKNPRHSEFKEENSWSLYNAFTETAKKYSPPRADYCYRTLSKIFKLE